jgi:chitin disaccharide deacetylase
MNRKLLIINADDYGLNEPVNEAIVHLLAEGAISSTTLMAVGPHAEDALSLIQGNKQIGLHLTLHSDAGEAKRRPAAAPSAIPSLLDEEGFLRESVEAFASNAESDEVSAELKAQYEWMVQRGCVPTHADNHSASLYGLGGRSFLKETLEFCARSKLPFRLPRTDAALAVAPEPMRQAHEAAVRYADALGVQILTAIAPNQMAWRVANLQTYDELKTFYFAELGRIEEGLTELFLHPAAENETLIGINPAWRLRAWEYRLLLDPEFKGTMDRLGIEKVTWQQIVG